MARKTTLLTCTIIALIVLLSMICPATSQNRGVKTASTMKTGFVYDTLSKKPLFLTVNGEMAEENGYLCCTFYKKGFDKTRWWREGAHKLENISSGGYEKKFAIDHKYYEGAYEVSLFRSKTPKNECTIAVGGCYFCRMWGFHLNNLLLYKTGSIR